MTASANDAMLEKVRKLLAQAEDPSVTEAEAEVFNAKAAELIAKYGIETAMLAHAGATCDQITQRDVVVHSPYRRDKAQLLATIAGALRCRTVHYTARSNTNQHRVVVFGFVSDVQRVELLFTSLLMQATTRLVRIRPANHYYNESTPAYRRSWLAGFTTAVGNRLHETERAAAHDHNLTEPAGTSTALVLADRTTQVDNAFTEAFPRLRTMPTRRLTGSGRSDGYHAGNQVDLGTASNLTSQRSTAIGR